MFGNKAVKKRFRVIDRNLRHSFGNVKKDMEEIKSNLSIVKEKEKDLEKKDINIEQDIKRLESMAKSPDLTGLRYRNSDNISNNLLLFIGLVTAAGLVAIAVYALI